MSRRRDAQVTGAAIYEVAVRLFAERGYHGTSLRAIAGAVDLQMATLYYYFPSKQALLLEIMRRTMRDLTALVRAAVDEVDQPGGQLSAAIRAHVGFHAERRAEAFIADSELRALDQQCRTEIVKLRDTHEGVFERIIRDGMAQGVFRPVDVKVTVMGLMAMCTGVAVWYRPDGPMSLDEIAAAYTDAIRSGIDRPARPER